MTVNELIERLTQLRDEGKGEHEVMDTDANPILWAVSSDDDNNDNLKRVYIESEF